MARGGKKDANAATAPPNPEAEERKRLKRIAISKNMISDAPAKACSVALSPSKTVAKHHGRDILRKSQRKNKFLFSFPGLLAPITGGKIGELKDLGTKNPILYLDFPQGQMKLFGTIVYPKTRYLTLQFSRGGKNVMCEDYFDTMIVFSDAWWIGRKDENPEEARLEFPKELNEASARLDLLHLPAWHLETECNFKGGAGGTCERKQPVTKATMKCVEQESPKRELEDDISDSQNDLKDTIEVTPTRHSARTAGKRFKFAEASSGDDSVENNTEKLEEKTKVGLEHPTRNQTSGNILNNETSCPVVFDIDNEDDAEAHNETSEQVKQSAISATKSKEPSRNKQSSLVQATISTLFKKVEEKVTCCNLKSINLGLLEQRSEPACYVSGQNSEHTNSKQKTDQVKVQGSRKKGKATEEIKTGKSTARKKQLEMISEATTVSAYRILLQSSPSSSPSGTPPPTRSYATGVYPSPLWLACPDWLTLLKN
ncbi:hypothetical protein LguiB_022503 [Lonicera macranthoides]